MGLGWLHTPCIPSWGHPVCPNNIIQTGNRNLIHIVIQLYGNCCFLQSIICPGIVIYMYCTVLLTQNPMQHHTAGLQKEYSPMIDIKYQLIYSYWINFKDLEDYNPAGRNRQYQTVFKGQFLIQQIRHKDCLAMFSQHCELRKPLLINTPNIQNNKVRSSYSRDSTSENKFILKYDPVTFIWFCSCVKMGIYSPLPPHWIGDTSIGHFQ